MLSNALMTIAAMSVAAAVTVGLLVLAGVGDEESREERVDRMAEELAANTLRDSPTFCQVVRPGGFIDTVFDFNVLVGEGPTLSGEERRLLADRFEDELRTQCRESRR